MKLDEMISSLERLRDHYGGDLTCAVWDKDGEDLAEVVLVDYDVFEVEPDAVRYVLFEKTGDPGV